MSRMDGDEEFREVARRFHREADPITKAVETVYRKRSDKAFRVWRFAVHVAALELMIDGPTMIVSDEEVAERLGTDPGFNSQLYDLRSTIQGIAEDEEHLNRDHDETIAVRLLDAIETRYPQEVAAVRRKSAVMRGDEM